MNISKEAIAFPVNSIPNTNTKAHFLLTILLDGNKHKRNDIILHKALGESMRSALQDLRGDKYENWLIHSGVCEKTQESVIWLDPRHLLGDAEQDLLARKERRKEFKALSAKDAKQGRIREPRAIRELNEANNEYFKSLGMAANEAFFKK